MSQVRLVFVVGAAALATLFFAGGASAQTITAKAVLKVDTNPSTFMREGWSNHVLGISGGTPNQTIDLAWKYYRKITPATSSGPMGSFIEELASPGFPSTHQVNLSVTGRWGGSDINTSRVTLYPYYYTSPLTWTGTASSTVNSSLGNDAQTDGPKTL